MIKKSEERKDIHTEKKDSIKTYKEFYDEWVKTSQNSFGKFYQIPTMESNKETFEKLLVSAEESKKVYGSWIAELEGNSRATREVLQGEADAAKYKEVYDMWIKSYEKMLNELLTLPLQQNMKEIFQNITGTPDIYSEAFEQISKIWKDSYAKLYVPYVDSMLKLSMKSAEISRGNASPEVYKEFHTLWMDTYQETYGRLFDNFFENTPTFSPVKEIMEPVKNAARIYADTFASISRMLVKSYPSSTIAI